MQMLVATGIEVIADRQRIQDSDNPRGYFEHEQVKHLAREKSIFNHSEGKAVKVIHALLEHIPRDRPLAVLFLHRSLDEVLASQSVMLNRMKRSQPTLARDRMLELLAKQLVIARQGLASRPDTSVLEIQHRQLINAPVSAVQQIVEFLGPIVSRSLDSEAMIGCVDPSLYRQRTE